LISREKPAAKKAGEEFKRVRIGPFQFPPAQCGSFSGGSLFGRQIFLSVILLCGFFRNGAPAGTCSVSEKSISKGDTKHDDARNPKPQR
jgi:hypothetical protein